MTEHTPTPWSVFPPETPEVTKQNCINRLVIVAGDSTVAVFNGCSHQHATEEERANARFIVRACNAHDDLLAACKLTRKLSALYSLAEHPDEQGEAAMNEILEIHAAIEAAIAKAEGA